ncbi:OsmC family protein [Xanthobacter dioxanivorans]|uniref:OsmC family protein n=1 Tax=Xanthobacter dioxanivorans TaxID=2528964 RepID=A0A974PS39_9HYPH|nr:OsmC family protein [Xanthobacter dioxanivorans]QRG08344.1 OsmC family protein [Xanthobacter dioxanivorans]
MAHDYQATIRWARGEAAFTDGRYSRGHVWAFDGIEVPGSSAPSSVRVPLSREDAVDPEEALVASAASCHMLFALDFARRAGFRVDSYEDAATGEMTPNEKGKLFVSRISLNPVMVFSGEKLPSGEDVAALHHRAHEECYVAHSLRADIIITPRFTLA